MENIELIIGQLQERNKRVELDKAWETSWTRKIILIILTYLIIVSFFFISQLPKPLLNAIVPTIGLTISTLSLDIIKKIWLKYFYSK